jgi:hypothetical protein
MTTELSDADKRLRFVIEYPEKYAHNHAHRCYRLTTTLSHDDPVAEGFDHEKYRMYYEEGLRLAAEAKEKEELKWK